MNLAFKIYLILFNAIMQLTPINYLSSFYSPEVSTSFFTTEDVYFSIFEMLHVIL